VTRRVKNLPDKFQRFTFGDPTKREFMYSILLGSFTPDNKAR